MYGLKLYRMAVFFEEPGMGTAESLEIETKRSDLSIWPALILAVQE